MFQEDQDQEWHWTDIERIYVCKAVAIHELEQKGEYLLQK